MTGAGSPHPRVLVLGAGLTGLALASLLQDEQLHVRIIEQELPPGRSSAFHGIVTGADLASLGLSPAALNGRPFGGIRHFRDGSLVASSAPEQPDWWVVEHGVLLDALRARFRDRGGQVITNQGEVEFVWRQGEVGGMKLWESGLTFDADLVILADESDPRLAELIGLRPDWAPTELMHLAKQRYETPLDRLRNRFGGPGEPAQITAFIADASWGSAGYGLVVPGQDAVTVKVAMLLEDEMATARHIREYLDEQMAVNPFRDLLDGLDPGKFVTECIPVGGYDTRSRFHTDNVLVVNDLVGITHPLNRDGMSTTLAMCQLAVGVIGGGDFSGRRLAAYSKRLGDDLIAPISAHRSRDRRPPWQWASLPELLTGTNGVTADLFSAKLPAGSSSGILGRLRKLGRRPGVSRHSKKT